MNPKGWKFVILRRQGEKNALSWLVKWPLRLDRNGALCDHAVQFRFDSSCSHDQISPWVLFLKPREIEEFTIEPVNGSMVEVAESALMLAEKTIPISVSRAIYSDASGFEIWKKEIEKHASSNTLRWQILAAYLAMIQTGATLAPGVGMIERFRDLFCRSHPNPPSEGEFYSAVKFLKLKFPKSLSSKNQTRRKSPEDILSIQHGIEALPRLRK